MSSFHYENVWSHPNKPLREHLTGVAEIARVSIRTIPLNFPIEKDILREVVYLTGLYHDIGKATSFFQEYLREKDDDRKARLKNRPETRHSLISAIATYFAVEEYLKKINFENDYATFLPIASFLAVRRHHTNLRAATEDLRLDTDRAIKKQVDKLYTDYLSFLPNWALVYEKLKTLPDGWPLRKLTLSRWLKEDRRVLPYLVQHLFYSLLLDADKHEATVGPKLGRKSLISDMIENYRREKGFGASKSQMDILRTEIYQKVLSQIKVLNLDQDHILSLSAPTGSGKTLTALAFAIGLRERIAKEKRYYPRIIYCLPFLSIIDQNAEVIEEVFKVATGEKPYSDYFLVHHHLSDYTYREEDTEYGPDESEILIEGWNSEIIITTFVQLFHTLFTEKNRAIRKFHKTAGSIIVLDEIQSFPHYYWLLFKETGEAMAKHLNTYFILSTATQPAIFANPKELLMEKEKYFKSFERTQMVIKIAPPKTVSEFTDEIVRDLIAKHKSTLIVLNTIRSAENIWQAIKTPLKKEEFETYFLSSYVVPIERIERIRRIKASTHKKVVISTQLVEAGVDIDLERVIRDLGPIDSINQVAGRANRNLRMQLADVEVVMLVDERNKRTSSYIYDPVLIDCTKRLLQSYSTIPEDDFLNLSIQYYHEIQKSISDNTSKEYLDAIRILNYEKIAEFELFKERGDKVDIFVELTDQATEVWHRYQEIIRIKELKERKQEFLKIRRKFYSYVISVLARKAKKNLPPEVSGFRFISKNQLQEFYDPETGFKAEAETLIW